MPTHSLNSERRKVMARRFLMTKAGKDLKDLVFAAAERAGTTKEDVGNIKKRNETFIGCLVKLLQEFSGLPSDIPEEAQHPEDPFLILTSYFHRAIVKSEINGRDALQISTKRSGELVKELANLLQRLRELPKIHRPVNNHKPELQPSDTPPPEILPSPFEILKTTYSLTMDIGIPLNELPHVLGLKSQIGSGILEKFPSVVCPPAGQYKLARFIENPDIPEARNIFEKNNQHLAGIRELIYFSEHLDSVARHLHIQEFSIVELSLFWFITRESEESQNRNLAACLLTDKEYGHRLSLTDSIDENTFTLIRY